ncbi:hypothetical protein BDK51DRAFT_41472 [Blyttiomyces helicus]|uniref:Uncharacterized protein n=1 Tax=Blyttiomyces helicus TaxID=388810 RepID=A0A4P9WL30_9FUNG|nr:hypothetical protein BDK51DRAFT_41472 [Blyttiomyces helicus]|eukprot:RKO92753.1 hypothetical protein BDK51DRAFT_41472 [Blyttiomyces helicus]
MTTVPVRVFQNNPSPNLYTGPNFEAITENVTGIPVGWQMTTFAPVSDDIITEIMGFVSLGLAQMGSDSASQKKQVSGKLFVWHTWITRMNEWLKAHEKVYPKIIQLPYVTVAPELHFLSHISGKDASSRVTNAEIAPIGPLFPDELGTLLAAMRKGIDFSGKNHDDILNTTKSFTKFIKDLDKVSSYAIEPQSESGQYTLPELAQDRDILPGKTPGTFFLGKNPITFSQKHKSSAASLKTRLIEKFKGHVSHIRAKSHWTMWIWIVFAMILVYFFYWRGDGVESEKPGHLMNTLTGGGKRFMSKNPLSANYPSVSDFLRSRS